MKMSRNFTLALAALYFGLLVLPQGAHAASVNCPAEPKTGVPIAWAAANARANCTLNTPADLDGFVFNANSGDIYQVIAGVASGTQNICMTLYDPNGKQVFSGCSGIGQGGVPYVQADVTIAVTGVYTVDLNEEGNGTVNYGLSLERLFPTPADAQAVTLAQLFTGNIAPVADTPAFTFAGVTTGQFRVAASLPTGATANICETVYSPQGVSVATGCTGLGQGGNTFVDLDFTPTLAGTYLVILSEQTNSTTTSYDFEVSCLSGKCLTITPPCTLKDALTYDATSSTLTMNFTEGNTAVDTWNAWLTDQNTMTNLFTVAQPITNPPQPITKTTTLSPEGNVGVLSTITTPKKGIICSVYTQINTGTPK